MLYGYTAPDHSRRKEMHVALKRNNPYADTIPDAHVSKKKKQCFGPLAFDVVCTWVALQRFKVVRAEILQGRL